MTDPPKLIPPPAPEPDTHWCLTCDPPTRLRGSNHAGPDHRCPFGPHDEENA